MIIRKEFASAAELDSGFAYILAGLTETFRQPVIMNGAEAPTPGVDPLGSLNKSCPSTLSFRKNVHSGRREKPGSTTICQFTYFICISLSIIFFSASIGHAAFQYLDVGARPLGINGACSAVIDDVNSMVWNVGSMNKISRPELTTMYSSMYPGVLDSLWLGYIAYVHPMEQYGVLGVNGTQFGSNLYSEQVFSLAYSNSLPFIKTLHLGVSLKYMGKIYGENAYTRRDPTFVHKYSAAGIGCDIGVLYDSPIQGLSFAVVGKNVNQPDIAVKKHDIVPAEYRVGVGYKINSLVFDVDGVVVNNANSDKRILLGSELWVLNNIAGIRAGVGFGTNDNRSFALGFSCNFVIIQFVGRVDYSYNYNLYGMTANITGNHQISLSLKF